MEKLEKDWIAYPILHLDLNTENYSIPQSLELKLERALSAWEQLYGSDPAEKSLAFTLEGIIQRAYEKTGQRVVILVDEYDKPMLQAIGNEALQNGLPQYAERVLRSTEKQRRLHPFRDIDGSDQIQQSQCIQ